MSEVEYATEKEAAEAGAAAEATGNPETGAFVDLRNAFKDLKREHKAARQENDELRQQLEQVAPVREMAVEHLAATQLGLDPKRARAAARLHTGEVSAQALQETVDRFGLDKRVAGGE